MTFDEIVKACKAEVILTVNEHRASYESSAQFLNTPLRFSNVDSDELKRMIQADTIYELQFYPNTPVAFHVVYGTSLEEVVTKASALLGEYTRRS